MSSASVGKSAYVVAVTTSVSRENDTCRYRLNQSYVQALENARLIPLLVPPLTDASSVARVLDRVDAVLLSGGGDIEPGRYGANTRSARWISEERDATEIELVREARSRGMPTLAICRGMQILNVALGGTLIQDIASEWPGAIPHDGSASRSTRSHSISLEPRSRACAALGSTAVEVNSFHHQAIDRIADDLVITARAGDGIVEAVESTVEGWWALGVQWHPEDLVSAPDSPDRGIFNALARELEG